MTNRAANAAGIHQHDDRGIRKSPRETTPLQEAFMAALRRRCRNGARDGGQVVLPTGTAGVDEIAKVLVAIDRERSRCR
jgi:hypothetical protein